MDIIDHTSIPSAHWAGVRMFFGNNYKEGEHVYRRFCKMAKSTQAEEKMVEVNGFGYAPQQHEMQPPMMDTVSEGVTVRSIHATYGLAFGVSRQEQDDNLYAKLATGRTSKLLQSLRATMELIAHMPLNYAFDPARQYASTGVPLISANHPSPVGAQSNALDVPADISEVALEALTTQVSLMQDNRGLPINARPKNLIYHTENDFEVRRILDSSLQSNSNLNNKNVIGDSGIFDSRIPTRYLVDRDAWFVQTDVEDGGVTFTERTGIRVKEHTDPYTDVIITKADVRFSVCSVAYRGIYGSPGA